MSFDEVREELDQKFQKVQERLVALCERQKTERAAEEIAKRVVEKLAEEKTPLGENEIRALARVAIWKARRRP